MIRILSILSLILLVISSITGSLYWGSTQKVKRLESTITQLKIDLKDCTDSKELLIKSKAVDDSVAQSKQVIVKDTAAKTMEAVSKIKDLPKKCVPSVTKDEKPEIDIDTELPDDFYRVLPKSSQK